MSSSGLQVHSEAAAKTASPAVYSAAVFITRDGRKRFTESSEDAAGWGRSFACAAGLLCLDGLAIQSPSRQRTPGLTVNCWASRRACVSGTLLTTWQSKLAAPDGSRCLLQSLLGVHADHMKAPGPQPQPQLRADPSSSPSSSLQMLRGRSPAGAGSGPFTGVPPALRAPALSKVPVGDRSGAATGGRWATSSPHASPAAPAHCAQAGTASVPLGQD